MLRTGFWRDRTVSVRTWSIFAVYLALSAVFCGPIFVHPLAEGAGDWDQHTLYYAAVMRNAAFGDLPFWNPWYCGGNVLWANPQASLVSPVYLLALVMPITLAMKINVLAHYVTGCIGMHLVVRRIIGVKDIAVVVYLVSLFVFSGAMALHLAAGHTIYLPVLLLPLLVYCFWQAAGGRRPSRASGRPEPVEGRRSVLLGAAVVGFSILNGGSHVLPLAAVLLGGLGVAALVAGRTPKPLIVAAAILVLGCAYAAPRIAPVMAFTRSPYFKDTRPVKQPDFMSLQMLVVSFWDPAQHLIKGKVTPGVQWYGWQEYGNYLGRAGATLVLISAAWILVFRWRAHWREVSTALVLVMVLLLTAGEFAPNAPARWLRTLPLISNFRIPSRYTMLVSLTGALCVAFAARAWESLQRASRWRWFVVPLCVAGISEIVLMNRRHLENVFVLAADTQSHLFDRAAPTVAEHQLVTPGGPRVHRSFMLDSMLAGLSTLDCYEPLQVKSVAQPGPMAITGEGDVTITEQTFSPNRVTARVVVGPEPARVILNENFAAGWTANAGRVRAALPTRRPSVVLPAGYSDIVAFSYVPPGLWIGLAILVAAAGVSVVVWTRSTRLVDDDLPQH
jgi:hypothetical protein